MQWQRRWGGGKGETEQRHKPWLERWRGQSACSRRVDWDYTPVRWMCGPAVRSTSTQTFTHSIRTRCFHLLNDPVIVHSFFQDSQMINRFILMIRRCHRVLENKSTAPWVDIINLFCIGAEHYQSLTSQWSLQKRKEIKWRTTRDKFLASYI